MIVAVFVLATTIAGDPVADFANEGGIEAIAHGLLAGGGGGFLVTATALSAARTDKSDSLPWLVLMPPAGAVVGGVAAFGAVALVHPKPGQIALSTSTMWTGATEGFLLQLAVFDQSKAISAVPLRFATVLGGGIAGLVTGIGVSTLIDPSPGDVALANSAFLWGGALTGFAVDVVAETGVQMSAAPVCFALIAGSFVPYIAVLASYDALDVNRSATWLIEAGGAAGLVSGAIFAGVLQSGGAPPALSIGAAGVVTAAGVVVGVTGAVLLSDAQRNDVSVRATPTALLDTRGNVAPGVVVAGVF